MKKFYVKKEPLKEKTSTFLKLHRRHTITEVDKMSFNEEIRRAAANRAASADNIDQIDRIVSNFGTSVESCTRALLDETINGSAPSSVFITESELSSSWLYKNRRDAMEAREGIKQTPLPSTHTKKMQSPSEELGTVEFQNSGMKPVLIPTKKRPEKASSRCCYLTVVVMICICTLGLLSAIGGIVYLEVFSARAHKESANQMSSADELLRSAIKLRSRDAKSNKFIPYESKDILYSDVQTLINEANLKNIDAARFMTENPHSAVSGSIFQQTDNSAVKAFVNAPGKTSKAQFQTGTTERSIQINSISGHKFEDFAKESERQSKTTNIKNGGKNPEWGNSKEKTSDDINEDDSKEKGKDISFSQVFEGQKLADGIFKNLMNVKDRIFDHLSSSENDPPKEQNKQDAANSKFEDLPKSSSTTPFVKEVTQINKGADQKQSDVEPKEIPSSPKFKDNFFHSLPEDTSDKDVSNIFFPSVTNPQTTKSYTEEKGNFPDVMESHESFKPHHPDLLESKSTAPSATSHSQFLSGATLNNERESFVKAFNEPEEKALKSNKTNTFLNTDRLNYTNKVQPNQISSHNLPSSGQNSFPVESIEHSTLSSNLDQDRKEVSDMMSEIPLFSESRQSTENHVNALTSEFSDFVSESVIPPVVVGTMSSESKEETIPNRFGDSSLSDVRDPSSQTTSPTEGPLNFNVPIISANIAPVNFLKRFQQKPTAVTTQNPVTPKNREDLQASLFEVLKYLQPLDTKNKLPLSRNKAVSPTKNVNEKKVQSNESRFTTSTPVSTTTERMRYLQKLREVMFERYFG